MPKFIRKNIPQKKKRLYYTLSGRAVIPVPGIRVNIGGPTVLDPLGEKDWDEDTLVTPSTYYVEGGTTLVSTANPIDISNPTIPTSTPEAIFQTGRDDIPAAPDLKYEFPLAAGHYIMRIYVCEFDGAVIAPGQRVFTVQAAGMSPAPFVEIDAFDLVGFETGYAATIPMDIGTQTIPVVFISDVGNPAPKAIEIFTVELYDSEPESAFSLGFSTGFNS